MTDESKSLRDAVGNATRNQHFVTRAEQKLNALNADAQPQNMRIYSFRVTDRYNLKVELENPNGLPIGKNLSFLDLFSFDIAEDGGFRLNFEGLFAKYEANVATHSKAILEKLRNRSGDVKVEIIDLFAAKFLNFVRNPYCVQKVLNSFPNIATYYPTDPHLLAIYKRIAAGKKPHQKHLCSVLGITDEMYVAWLRTLFMLLFPNETHPSMFENLIKQLIEDRNTYVSAFVFEYDDRYCLLCDRSFSQPIPDGAHMAFSFNLAANAFVTYTFSNIDELTKDYPPHLVALGREHLAKGFNVAYHKNHPNMLGVYNMRAIEQCYERVFCAVKDFDVAQRGDSAIEASP